MLAKKKRDSVWLVLKVASATFPFDHATMLFWWWYLLVPALLHHLALNIGCPQQLVLLLLSSDEGRQIWSRVTGVGWWSCVGFESVSPREAPASGPFVHFICLSLKTFVHSKNSSMYTAARLHAGFDRRSDECRGRVFSLLSCDLSISDIRRLNIA